MPPSRAGHLRDALADDTCVALLLRNRLGPSLARALGAGGAPVPPLLAADARAAARRSLAAAPILRELTDHLAAARIPWLLWKGPALAMEAWRDASARHFTDLDVVVTVPHRAGAARALRQLGWRARHGLDEWQQRAIEWGSGAWSFERGDGEPLIELHWRFASPRFPEVLRVDEVLDRSEAVLVHGVECRTPRRADALLLLAVHGTKHGWSQGEEVATFAALLRRTSHQEVSALGFAPHRDGITRAAELAWALAAVLAGEGHLDERAESRDARRTREMARAAIHRMRAGDAGWRPTHRWSLAWIDRRSDRAKYWLTALLAPTLEEWKWLRLPAALAWLYPLVRVTRLALRR